MGIGECRENRSPLSRLGFVGYGSKYGMKRIADVRVFDQVAAKIYSVRLYVVGKFNFQQTAFPAAVQIEGSRYFRRKVIGRVPGVTHFGILTG